MILPDNTNTIHYFFEALLMIFVNILAKPQVAIYVFDGLLVCNATGFPPPRLIWYKDSKYVEKNKYNQRSLSIEKTVGNFTCVASNLAGTSSDSFIPAIPGWGVFGFFVFLEYL